MPTKKAIINIKDKIVIQVSFEFIFLIGIALFFVVTMSDLDFESKELFGQLILGLSQGFLGYVTRAIQEDAKKLINELIPNNNDSVEPIDYAEILQNQKAEIEAQLQQINIELSNINQEIHNNFEGENHGFDKY